MADSFTALLRLRQQTTGANNNTWGALLNAAMFQLLEDSVAGRIEKVVAGVDITLSTNNGASDEARKAVISLTGAPGATRNIIIPNVSKLYVVTNSTNAAQNVKTAAGAALSIPVGDRKFVLCDGADGVFGIADTLGGLDASAFARIASRNAYTAGNADVPEVLVDGGTITVDLALGNVFSVTLAGDRALAFTNPVDGSWADIYFTQDGTGGRDITFPANIIWDGGSAPVFSGEPNTTVLVKLRYFASITSFFGSFGSTSFPSGVTPPTNITIGGMATPVDVWSLAGQPGVAATVSISIDPGIILQSNCMKTPALDFSGFIAGSVISITIGARTYVIGAGGRGGSGATFDNDDQDSTLASGGEAGGPAIKLPSTACTISITNNGHIWGGGGGGGGGGAADTDVSWGGAGGGGAGGGAPGTSQGSSLSQRGGVGRLGTFGAGGAGGGSGGSPGAGGAGGAYGAAGTAGTTTDGDGDTGANTSGAGGAAGAAGKAIDYNGGSVPTYVTIGDIVGVTS